MKIIKTIIEMRGRVLKNTEVFVFSKWGLLIHNKKYHLVWLEDKKVMYTYQDVGEALYHLFSRERR